MIKAIPYLKKEHSANAKLSDLCRNHEKPLSRKNRGFTAIDFDEPLSRTKRTREIVSDYFSDTVTSGTDRKYFQFFKNHCKRI